MTTSLVRLVALTAGACAAFVSAGLSATAASPSEAAAGPTSVTEACTEDLQQVFVDCEIDYVGDRKQFHRLDFYAPIDPLVPPPVVIMVHGGGWKQGGKESLTTRAIYLAENGFAVVNVDYKLSEPEKPTWPRALRDVEAAQAWVVANAEAYGADPSTLGLYGVSAGGHLGGLLATQVTDTAHPIEATVTLSAPMDLNLAWDLGDTIRAEIAQFVGCTDHNCDNDGDLLRKASPTRYVSGDEGPMLLFHSKKEFVPVEVAEEMHELLDAAKVENELHVLRGARHGSEYECRVPPDETDKVIDLAVAWLGTHLIDSEFEPSRTFDCQAP